MFASMLRSTLNELIVLGLAVKAKACPLAFSRARHHARPGIDRNDRAARAATLCGAARRSR